MDTIGVVIFAIGLFLAYSLGYHDGKGGTKSA
jgi:hypothetical protein